MDKTGYFIAVVAWIVGIAVAVKTMSAGWIFWSVVLPPVAWVVLAMRYFPI